MALEELEGVVTEAGQQGWHLAGLRGVDAQFVDHHLFLAESGPAMAMRLGRGRYE